MPSLPVHPLLGGAVPRSVPQQPAAPYAIPAAPTPTCHPVPRLQPDWDPSHELWCEHCDGRIEWDDGCIEMFFGIAGKSTQTGLPSVVQPRFRAANAFEEDMSKQGYTAVVHIECLFEFAATRVVPEQAEEIIYQMAVDLAEEMASDNDLERKIEDPGS